MSVLGDAIAGFRNEFGETVTVDGVDYQCSVSTISDSEVYKYLPDGERNAGNPDYRVFAFTPTDVQPPEGGVISWHGVEYTVTRPYPVGDVTWRCLAYRTPKQGSSSANPTNSNGAWGP